MLEISNWPEDPLQGGLQQIIPKAPCGLALAPKRADLVFRQRCQQVHLDEPVVSLRLVRLSFFRAEKSEHTKECAGFVC